MKKLMLVVLVAVVMFSVAGNAHALVNVRGYIKSNGTYVAPHVRTNPDGCSWNNLSCWN